MDPELLREILDKAAVLRQRGVSEDRISELISQDTGGQFSSAQDVSQALRDARGAAGDRTAGIRSRRGLGGFRSQEEQEADVGRTSVLAQGLTLRFSDEIKGLLAGAIPGGQTREEAREEERQRIAQAQEEEPVVSGILEAGGALAGGIAAPSLLPARLGGLGNLARSAVGRVAPKALEKAALKPETLSGLQTLVEGVRGAAIGGGEGLLFALGGEEGNLGEKLSQVPNVDNLTTIAIGAFLGGGISGALAGLGKRRALIAGQQIEGGARTGRRSGDIVPGAQAAEEARPTGTKLAEQIRRRAEAGDPEGLGGLSPDEVVSRRPGRAPDILEERTVRQTGVGPQLGRAAETAKEQVKKVQKQMFRPLEDIEEIGSPQILQALQPQQGEDVAKVARKALPEAVRKGERGPSFTEVQSVLNTLRSKAKRAGRAGDPELVKQFDRAVKELESAMKNELEGFANAQRAFFQAKEAERAIERGTKMWNKRPEEIKRALEKLPTEEARTNFRAGLLARRYDSIAKKGELTRASITRLQSAGLRGRLRLIFRNEKDFREAMEAIDEAGRALIRADQLVNQREFWTKMVRKGLIGAGLIASSALGIRLSGIGRGGGGGE